MKFLLIGIYIWGGILIKLCGYNVELGLTSNDYTSLIEILVETCVRAMKIFYLNLTALCPEEEVKWGGGKCKQIPVSYTLTCLGIKLILLV